MYLRNSTCYPTGEVRRLVMETIEDVDHRHLVTRVSHTRVSKARRQEYDKYGYGATGLAHNFAYIRSDVPEHVIYEVHLRIGKPDDFPTNWFNRSRLNDRLEDWREALVAISAHEMRHIAFYQQGRRWPSKRELERACDATATHLLSIYRQNGNGRP